MKSCNLIIVMLTFLGLSAAPELVAQNSGYFTYDRVKVGSAVDGINEQSPATVPLFNISQDGAKAEPLGIPFSLTIGFLSGCIVSAGGCLVGFWLSDLEAAKVGLIIGSILGSVLPPVVVYSQTRSRKDLGFTALGGVVGVVPPIIGYAVTADAVRDVYEAINSFSELWSLLFDPEYSRSCTGMLPGGILR